MENLEIKVSKKTRMVDLPKQFITVDGENLQSKIIFSFIDEFVKGQARLEYEINNEKKDITLSFTNTHDSHHGCISILSDYCDIFI